MEAFQKYFSMALLAIMLAFVGYTWYEKTKMEDRIIALQNELAKRMPTIEVAPGVFEKLAQVEKDLQDSIDKSTAQGKDLAKRIDDTKSKVLSLQTGVLSANAKIDELLKPKPNPDGSWYADVDKKNGPLYLKGKITAGPTKDNPIHPELDFGITDLKLDLAVTQGEDGQWKAQSAVPPPVKLEWKSVNVNPYILDPHWYEKIKLVGDLGAGPTGFLGGLGIVYELEWFDAGPKVWATPSGQFAGVTFTYAPFKKGK
jgi:hypothetical protein